MADDADKAQAHAEWLEEFRAQHKRKHVMRASDYCVDCHELIEPQRLKAAPHTLRCIDCQKDYERHQAQYG